VEPQVRAGLVPVIVAACSLWPALSQEARAQTAAPATVDAIDVWNELRHKPASVPADDRDYTEKMKAVAPVIGAKPSSGVFGGVAGNVAFFRGEPATTHISSLVASLTFSSKQQTSLTGRFLMFARGDAWRFEGDDRAQWTSQDTYGLGSTTPADDVVNAKFDFFRVHQTVLRRLRHGVFAGFGFHYDDHADVGAGADTDDAEWANGGFVAYSRAHGLPADRQTSSGFSANLILDTRDNAIDPRGGLLVSSNYRGLINGFLGGTSGWQLVHAEARSYVPLSHDNRNRLAIWTFGDFTFGGTVPYFDLPATGMDAYGRSARGYSEGRFRGERLIYSELEYRTTLTTNGLLGAVAFLNATTVTSEQTGERLFDSGAIGGGGGLRVLLNKRSRTNLCFDVAFGKEGSHGVYLAVQEAF
jgi:outer membrane protein assembly factor BamA